MKFLSYKKRFKSLFSFRKRRCSIYSGTPSSVLVTLKPTLFLLLSKPDHTMTSFTFVTLYTGPSVRADLLKKNVSILSLTLPRAVIDLYHVSPIVSLKYFIQAAATRLIIGKSLWNYEQQNVSAKSKRKKKSNIAEGYMGSFKMKSLAILLSMRDWVIWYKKKIVCMDAWRVCISIPQFPIPKHFR